MGEEAFGVVEGDVDAVAVGAGDGAGEQLSLKSLVVCEYVLLFEFVEGVGEILLGVVGGDASELCGVDLEADFVLDLGSRNLCSRHWQRDFDPRVHDIFDDDEVRVAGEDAVGGVELHLDVLVSGDHGFLGGLAEGVLHGLDDVILREAARLGEIVDILHHFGTHRESLLC